MTERLGRPLLVTLAAVISALTAGFAPRLGPAIEIVLVENWTRQRLDSRGVPETWRAYDTIGGRPADDFAVVEIDGGRALRMRSHGDHSTIAKKIQIDLNTTPWLEWNWKVVALAHSGKSPAFRLDSPLERDDHRALSRLRSRTCGHSRWSLS